MADTSRKRSRKSKLVPREYAEEDDLELQIPGSKIPKSTKQTTNRQPTKKVVKTREPTISKPEVADTSVLKKINAAAKEDIAQQSPRKFEIDIEVESCDDDDEFAEVGDEDRVSPIDKDSLITRKVRTEPIELSREVILEAAENLLQDSTDIPDKILNIHVRNTIGYEDNINLVLDGHEGRIQQALDQWRLWQFRSFHRENPLFYKCYICMGSWWHLTDFRNHLSNQHTDDLTIIIGLEKYELHEANLIAYHQRLVVVLDIYTEGLCYRCGKNYADHELVRRFEQKYYMNKGCHKEFFTCMGLRDHLACCPVCSNRDKPFKCNICKSRFDTEEELSDHLVLSHSVRSDVPIMTQYKNCKNCSQKFSCQYLHKCKQKGPDSECPYCARSFPNVMSLEIHMERSKEPYKCEVCRRMVKYSCKQYEHMVTHTDNYMMVRKCVLCDGLNVFIYDEDAAAHRLAKHDLGDNKRQIFSKIIVPTSSIYQSLAELKLKEQKSLPEERESIQKEEESIQKEEEESIQKEEEESIQKEEESTLEEESELRSVRECEQKLLQAELESDFYLGTVVVKDEPEDQEEPEDSPRLVIKEEPFEAFVSQMHEKGNLIANFEHEISVKEEIVEEEYEEDIIKLNFDIEDLFVKQESIQEDDDDTTTEQTVESQDSENDDTEEFSEQLKGDSMLEPEVIIEDNAKKHRKLYKCTKCGFTAKHRQYKNHIDYDCGTRPARNKSYTCTKCKQTFMSMKKYLTHFRDHGYHYMVCPDCLKQFDTFTQLGRHIHQHIKQNFVRVKMITHAGKEMVKPDFQCKKCGKVIGFRNFFEHWELHINAQPTHPIKVTSRPKHERGELHQTIIKECIARLNRQSKECNHCHRWFNRVNECKRHIIEHLLTDAYNQKHIYNELKCQVCEKGFPTPEKYKQHMRDHASLPVYKCELCDRTFSDSSNFTKHKKVHNLKVIICDLCRKKFQSKMSLEKHMAKHSVAKPITCEVCNKIFYFETTYRRHVRYYHEKAVIGLRCIICNSRFQSAKLKWDHMWEVHKERKQKADCPICHESFRKYSDVRLHARKKHMTEITVVNIRKKTATPNLGIDMQIKPPMRIRAGPTETLVVYDSD